ncbi:hypothetical protein MRS76_14260 [Rhizobiaceae bacterium n13]|uniref:Uncharacterized protein n=1 Tax=Ferirhizobium litorale TaxID=2927786 RepID=A0AAE3U301_9HYPH|nr:hypothetical protein [Fererhizobium litorale]MDI7863120.1 hypothetical protein [Fererhizobium litorale]MDI7923202.1 hypothetical protein [Fererhizobium litorale]
MTDDNDVNRDLMKGDEDISPVEFAADEAAEPDFGNWPEIIGVVATALLIWFTFAFTG